MKQNYIVSACVLLFSALMLLPASGYGQNESSFPEPARNALGPRFGITGGVNLANFTGVEGMTLKNLRIGYNVGVFGNFPISNVFAIQPEILKSTKGTRLVYKETPVGTGEYSVDADYIEVPVNINVRFDPMMHAFVGGYVSYLTSASTKSVWSSDADNGIANLTKEDFNQIDYGFNAGLGVDLQRVTVGMRYSQGLTSIGKSSSIVGNARNMVVALTLGCSL